MLDYKKTIMAQKPCKLLTELKGFMSKNWKKHILRAGNKYRFSIQYTNNIEIECTMQENDHESRVNL